MKMDGKTVLITGSTDGVGRYVAAKLAAAGAKVLIHGRDKERANSLADEIRRQGHAEPIFYPADLSSLAGTRQLAEAVLADHGRIDVFISNAGIGSRTLGAERQHQRGRPRVALRGELPLGLPARVSVAALASRQPRRRGSSMSPRSASTRSISTM